MRTLHSRAAAFAFSFAAVAGCSEITTPNIALVDAEVHEAFFLLQQINALAFNPPVVSSLRHGAVVRPSSASAITAYEFQADCPAGGTTNFVGTVDRDEVSGAEAGDFTITHIDCRNTGPSDRTWTFNGNPNLRLQSVTDEASASFDGTLTGNFRYRVGARRGDCNVNLTYAGVGESGLISVQLCNRSVSYAAE